MKRSLKSVQETIEKNKKAAKKYPERCETCLKWDGKKCMKAKPPVGCGPNKSMEPWDCCMGWISKDGKRKHPLAYVAGRDPILPKPVTIPDAKIEAKPCVYVVLAKRWGCDERHSYVVGAKETLGQAQALAEAHEQYRGGKYLCEIDCCPLTETSDDFLPVAVRSPEPTQPEPMIGEYVCHGIYKCAKYKKGKKA